MLALHRGLVLVFAVLCAAGLQTQAQTPADPRLAELRAKLERDLTEQASRFDGVMGIGVKDLTTGETFLVQGDVVFPQASSIKIPILIELLRQAQEGQLKLEERVELRRAQMTGGSGVLQRFGDGTSALSLRDLATLMIVLSDNTATNVLIDRIGMENVNATLRRLGLKETMLQRRMIDIEAGRASRENVSTPREMLTLLEQLQAGKTLDPTHTSLALEILRYPKNTALRRGVPGRVPVANKPGGLAGVACDSGIVSLERRPYLLTVMTTYAQEDSDPGAAITAISRRVFQYFERLAAANQYGVLVQ